MNIEIIGSSCHYIDVIHIDMMNDDVETINGKIDNSIRYMVANSVPNKNISVNVVYDELSDDYNYLNIVVRGFRPATKDDSEVLTPEFPNEVSLRKELFYNVVSSFSWLPHNIKLDMDQNTKEIFKKIQQERRIYQ
jgi:hypothetical protein